MDQAVNAIASTTCDSLVTSFATEYRSHDPSQTENGRHDAKTLVPAGPAALLKRAMLQYLLTTPIHTIARHCIALHKFK